MLPMVWCGGWMCWDTISTPLWGERGSLESGPLFFLDMCPDYGAKTQENPLSTASNTL